MRSKIAELRVVTSFGSWMADRIEYAVTSVRLAIIDRICGPESRTLADIQREAEKEMLQRTFRAMDLDRKTKS
jgi:hypothetical protein